ncbi:single-stranded-DNA-specific exonuclease RecJ [Oenococcus alcoholitolerans]|uniref:single-stranded-DNA-specific exonuclease RecJ n=1 Tax=Oenococcus alcoholitolerans TaxID=931074 RepID=UPI003F70A486
MLDNQYEWKLADADPKIISKISNKYHFGNFMSTILAQRFSDSDRLEDAIGSDPKIIDPAKLKNIDKLKDILDQAKKEGKKITIYGDYDTDGVTSTSILYKTLQILGLRVDYYIPDRFKDGYGPNLEAYKRLVKEGSQIIFAIDNGITGYQAASYLKDNHIDFLIADHHQIPEKLPEASVIIHTELSPDYPFKGLSAAGLAYKIAVYLLGKEAAAQFLPLVAAGEIADVMPLTGENKSLVKAGLKAIGNGLNQGISMILKKAGIDAAQVTSENLAFSLAPRLNSLGRMANASALVELLTSQDTAVLAKIATEVEKSNRQRQSTSDKIFEKAQQQVDPLSKKVIICEGRNWHQGVIGIIAGRLADKFSRPAIVFSIDENGVAKGSARSIGNFNIFELLNKAKDLYLSFGGHPQAAGLSLPAEKLDIFHSLIDEKDVEIPARMINIDYCASNNSPISYEDYLQVQKLEPFGEDNPKPVIELSGQRLLSVQILGKENKHFKLTLSNFVGEVIFFNRPDLFRKLQVGENVSVVGTLSVNEWRGRKKLQLVGKDLRSEEKLPNRSVFGHAYHYLLSKKVVYSPNDFYQKVFLELGFVKIENGFVSVNEHAEHAELSQSKTYRKRAENEN